MTRAFRAIRAIRGPPTRNDIQSIPATRFDFGPLQFVFNFKNGTFNYSWSDEEDIVMYNWYKRIEEEKKEELLGPSLN